MQPGDVIGGRFQIERLAAAGGMGSIYAAIDRSSGERVALKVMRETVGTEVERFLREARMLADLDHPHIVRYIAHGISGAAAPFLAMEWLEGEDLGSRLRRGPLRPDDAVSVVACAARALGVAHARGIVHRDIKPSNLFIVGGVLDEIRVIDFGIARAGGQTAMTRTGAIVGTLGYMAPEQASAASSVDARADVFALGCVLFECLTGKPAFAGEHLVAVLTKVLFEDPPAASSLCPAVSASLDELVAGMLAKQPEHRLVDGNAVAAALSSLGRTPDPDAVVRRPPPALTRAEMRSVGVVLATPLPEDVAFAATRAESLGGGTIAELRELIGLDGARVEALAGGALAVVIAGAGSATDQAVQAARCALAIRAARPDATIAVVTGRALIAGVVPVGEAIDRAARLLKRGGMLIHIDDVTEALLGARFEIDAHQLRGERHGADDTRTLLGRSTPFVGRDRELQFLEGMVAECSEEPIARAVLVTAPAGAGKSRLRRELLATLERRSPPIQVWIARGDSMREGSPFGMIARALEHAFGVIGGESPEVEQARLVERVSRFLGGEEVSHVAAFLGELIGMRFPDEDRPQLRAARRDPLVMGDRMREAWLTFVTAVCEAGPLAIVLEDLHWGDLPSVSYLDAALARLRDRPLFVLATARPEVKKVFPGLWAERELQELKLGTLTRSASARLVREVLGARAEDADVARLIDRASGNAFFLEELIRAEAEGKGADAPETVLAMLHARLEELPPNARHVLRAASVFGEVFWRGGIQALLGSAQTATELDRTLALLVEREVVSRRHSGRFGEEELAFRHALVRDAAYGMLTDADRVLGHKLAGDWLQQAGERDPMTIAEHFERGAAPERAIMWFERAAEQALEGNDLTAALARAERGIICGAAGAARGALRLTQAIAHDWRGENAEASLAAAEAYAHFPAGSEAWFKAACELSVADRRLGRRNDIEQIGRALCVIGELDVASGASLRSVSRTAIQVALVGYPKIAAALVEGMARHEPSVLPGDPGARAWVLAARGLLPLLAGDPSLLVRDAAMIESSVDEGGDRRSCCNLRLYTAIAAREIGAYALAERLVREAVAIADALGFHTMSATCRGELGYVLYEMGRNDEALAISAAVPAEQRAQGDRMQEANTRNTLAKILLVRGALEASEDEAQRSLELMPEGSPFRAHARAVLAQIVFARGRHDEALAIAAGAATTTETRVGFADSLVFRVYAEVLQATGDLEGARQMIRRARSSLLERADRFGDASWRSTFLEGVAANAKLLALCAELGVTA